MKEYKYKKMQNFYGVAGSHTQGQVIRIADGKEMLDVPHQESVAKRYAKEMNEKTSFGIYLIGE